MGKRKRSDLASARTKIVAGRKWWEVGSIAERCRVKPAYLQKFARSLLAKKIMPASSAIVNEPDVWVDLAGLEKMVRWSHGLRVQAPVKYMAAIVKGEVALPPSTGPRRSPERAEG